MKTNKSVSVVVAGYNEEDNIKSAMKEILDSLEQNFEMYELILVDDASKDSTLRLMQEFADTHDHVRVLCNHVNLNFGTSVLRGMIAAQYDYVTYNACDLPIKPEDMVQLICNMHEDTDVLVMQRTDYVTTKWRGITSKGNQILLKILFPKLTKDTPVLNYSQIYRRSVLNEILPFARSPIFVWPELVFRAKLKGKRIENVPVKCNVSNLRKGAFGHPHDIIWGMYEMLRFRLRVWKGDYE